ncbi:hypothetical protein Purlil1_6841 [Purpureocillium lilacinum]|uniref:Uncharacterized protein n=1 Tax=Purpureocillium lilacinum TaxID=33203 RepID=A0ABR0BZ90_PURLI|nr:hypothetical protein Purlil1_6841 [Purpureocillium lilacinum]
MSLRLDDDDTPAIDALARHHRLFQIFINPPIRSSAPVRAQPRARQPAPSRPKRILYLGLIHRPFPPSTRPSQQGLMGQVSHLGGLQVNNGAWLAKLKWRSDAEAYGLGPYDSPLSCSDVGRLVVAVKQEPCPRQRFADRPTPAARPETQMIHDTQPHLSSLPESG